MAHLFIFDPETATPDEIRNFWSFLVNTGKVEIEVEKLPHDAYKIHGKIFERLPFVVWGHDRDDAILQAVREYRKILMTVGTVISDEVEEFKKEQE